MSRRAAAAVGTGNRPVRRRRQGAAAWSLALGLCLALLASGWVRAQQLAPVPRLETRVTDRTGTLTAEQQNSLEQKLAAFEARKGTQLVVLIVSSTAPEEIAAYSIRVVQQWKLGRKRVDDGALLLVAKNDRRLRIEVGYGLEGVLNDATCNRIIDETISPLFRQGDFFAGINAGVDRMIQVIEGEPLPPPDPRWAQPRRRDGTGVLPLVVGFVFVGAGILQGILGRLPGALLTGAGVGGLLLLGGYALTLALLAAFAGAAFALFLGATRGSGWSSGPRIGGWGGGFGGGGGGGSSFGGGGGGFGGGGASGRW